MSSTTPGEYRGFCFWVFDVCKSILFAEMATVASERPAAERSAWLADLEDDLRVHAIIGDLAIPLDEWCDGHEEQFLALVTWPWICRVDLATKAGWHPDLGRLGDAGDETRHDHPIRAEAAL